MNNKWKNVLLTENKSIRDALYLIDKEALRICLVVDENQTLIGTVTDGDIRRGFLKNMSMEDNILCVVNKSPTVASPDKNRKELVSLMNLKGLLSIPILEGGKVVGLEMLHEHDSNIQKNNPVFLMAGGFGTRLRPLTDSCPKPLLKVGNRPILETTLLNFIDAGFCNFFISTHYMPEMIRNHFGDGSKWNVNIQYVHEDVPLGTGGALGLLPDDLIDLPLIMMNGDVLTNIDYNKLLEFHNASQAEATMCVREYAYQIPYGVIKGKGSKVISMEEKPVQRFFINAGIYVINSSLVKSVSKNIKIDMPSLLEKVISEDKDVVMFPIHEYWLDIGRMDDFTRAQIDILQLGMQHD